MIRTLTQFDVLRYVYGETNEKVNQTVHEDILTNDAIADEFVNLSEAKALLDKCTYSASEKTLSRILAYSKSQVKESAK